MSFHDEPVLENLAPISLQHHVALRRYGASATFAVLLALLVFFHTSSVAYPNHLEYLPYVPNTPLMKSVKVTQEQVWCVDARASAYPNFVSQLRDVNDQYTARTGIRHRQVAFSDSACQVRHTMPENHQCSGCAAWVFYTNWPVTIEYRWQVGYTDWRTTQGHELGHALLGLHEQYIDAGGSIQCDTSRLDTVMSCGTGVRYPMPRDVRLGCAVLAATWCGSYGSLQCGGAGNPYYDLCLSRWVFADGWSFDPKTLVWWNPQGQPEWTACNADGLRYNLTIQGWLPPPSAFFLPSRGFWAVAGAC